MSEDVTVAVTREVITITADNGETVTVTDPQVTVVTDVAPATSAAASAAEARALFNRIYLGAY